MRSGSFESLVIWGFLFIVFGPMVAVMLTESLDAVVAQLAPVAGLAGVILLGVLAIRMLFRRY